jgi:lysophospholipase L1-like esterase
VLLRSAKPSVSTRSFAPLLLAALAAAAGPGLEASTAAVQESPARWSAVASSHQLRRDAPTDAADVLGPEVVDAAVHPLAPARQSLVVLEFAAAAAAGSAARLHLPLAESVGQSRRLAVAVHVGDPGEPGLGVPGAPPPAGRQWLLRTWAHPLLDASRAELVIESGLGELLQAVRGRDGERLRLILSRSDGWGGAVDVTGVGSAAGPWLETCTDPASCLRVACLGDSNTDPGNRAWPLWCEQLGPLADGREVFVENLAVGGATAFAQDNRPMGPQQLDLALAGSAPDVVIAAFGTNDLYWHDGAFERSVAALEEMKRRVQAAGARFLVATVPPMRGEAARFAEQVTAANRLLRERFGPDEIVDFDTGFDSAAMYQDTVHLSAAGQQLRAERARHAIAAAPAPGS